ncbi:MAG: N-acetylmuramoyl-L-alanine amidase, partial [Planctomycetota bacterium]
MKQAWQRKGIRRTSLSTAALVAAVFLAIATGGCRGKSSGPETDVLAVTPEDQLLPPAGWVSPYKAFREVAADRRPRTTLDDAVALIDRRGAWTDLPNVDPDRVPRHPGEKYLQGQSIVLDPGHGGDSVLVNYKRGPTGVREAEVNLRVALLLRRLLEDAGVDVHLTRDRDNDLSLADRAALASRVDADWFISLHHNAAASPDANYTSVWLHSDYASNGPALDLARHVGQSLLRHLRTDAGVTSPIMLDTQVHEVGGFGVLRGATVPAILVESSFHSNPDEEQRLREGVHNLREAYAIYEALCEYATLGRPTQTITLTASESLLVAEATLDTGLPNWWGHERRGPLPATVQFFADGERLATQYNEANRLATATLPADAKIIELHHTNPLGHRNWPQRYAIGDDASLTSLPPLRRQSSSPRAETDAAMPWRSLPMRRLPIFLHQGGDTAAQELIDAFPLPDGGALTVARIDSATGTLYALRHQDDTRRGKNPTGDNGFDPGDALRLATAFAAGDADTVTRALSGDASRWAQVQQDLTLQGTAEALADIGLEKLTLRQLEGVTGEPMPLNVERHAPTSDDGKANWATTDDLVRLLAAALMTRDDDDSRRLALVNAMRNDPGSAMLRLNAGHTVVTYWHDSERDRHYLLAAHVPQGDAATVVGDVIEVLLLRKLDL